jgi:flagellar hook-length control protein FliK
MQGLGNLIASIGSQDMQSLQALTDAAAAAEAQGIGGFEFLGLLQQRLDLLATAPADGSIAAGDGAEKLAAGSAGLASLFTPAVLDYLKNADANADIPTLSDLDLPDDLSAEDIDLLKQIDLGALIHQLQQLRDIDAAVMLDNGETLSVEDLLSLLTGDDADIVPVSDDAGEATVAEGEQTALLGLDASAAVQDEPEAKEPAITVANDKAKAADAGQSPAPDDASLFDEEGDMQARSQDRKLWEQRLSERQETRDGRLAAADPDDDGDADGFESLFAQQSPQAHAKPAATISHAPHASSAANLAALAAVGSGAGKGFEQSLGQGGQGSLDGTLDDGQALSQQAQIAAQNAGGSTTFQAILASANAPRSAMHPATMQVSIQLQNAASQGQSQLRINLEPAELGRIDVELDFDDKGSVKGRLIIEKPETLDMLRNDSRTLEKALQDAGLQLDAGGLQYSLGNGSGANPDSGATDGRHAGGDMGADNSTEAEMIEPGHIDIIAEDKVDVRV